MTPEDRKRRVEMLFAKIALIAEVNSTNPQLRDQLIKPMVEELWAVTQQQEELHELDYKRVGVGKIMRGDAWEG